ncbi:hypothetical protein AB3S75_011612 [Citrus x aurantiifolia]
MTNCTQQDSSLLSGKGTDVFFQLSCSRWTEY